MRPEGGVRILLVANPISGRRRGPERVRELAERLVRRGHAVELHFTRSRGDARARAREADPALERLVVAGGDGTLNEVLNGLADPGKIALAQLPLGTANLLGHEFALPRDPAACADLVERGAVRRLDLGLLGERRFLAVASCGFDAMVTAALERRSGALGYRGYLAPIWRTLRSYRPPALRVSLDGAPALAGALVVASHVRNYGGLFCVTPDAAPDSGVLHVCVFASATIADLARYAAAGLRGGMSHLRGVTSATARRVTIESDEPVAVEVDGDACGATPAVIEVVPRCVPFLVPA
jgi:YegS/Rv2252/BmrU family lipid kinase